MASKRRGPSRGSQRRSHESAGFTCGNCGWTVSGEAWGTKQRNHCPSCLWSRHVDESIGDRRSACNQFMEPIALSAHESGEWSIVHRCTGCGQLRANRVAGDDDEVALLRLALRPLARPAFPLDDFRT
ncbi:MAG: RNHCP domain-containing protein [Planctomycetota bacterium]